MKYLERAYKAAQARSVAITTKMVANEMSDRDAEDTGLASHVVSAPLASSPTTLVVPTTQAVHTLDLTYSLIAQVVLAQEVSAPEALSPTALVVPAAHAVHTLDFTY